MTHRFVFIAAAAFIIGAACTAFNSAHAQQVSIRIDTPEIGIRFGTPYPQPIYAPVYSPPIYSPPVYSSPAYSPPIYSPPVYEPPIYSAPILVAPPPVYYRAPRYVVAPPRVFAPGPFAYRGPWFNPPGHGRKYWKVKHHRSFD